MYKKSIAIIPARLGSQRLKKKNLELFNGVPLIEHAIMRALHADVFDEIYVNSESLVFKEYADKHQVSFYKRPNKLGDNKSTSEDFILDFFLNVECDDLYQIHSITPLLGSGNIRDFYNFCNKHNNYDTVLSCINDQIEVAYQNKPVNFITDRKTNSQDLLPTQRITWSITKWRRDSFINAVKNGKTGTYSGHIGFFSVSSFSGLAIKTIDDLNIANALKDFI